MRLDRILSNSGYGSRSEIKRLIHQGRVTVDGQGVKNPAYDVKEAQKAVISLDGRVIFVRRFIHLMQNKPAGWVTALYDSHLPTIAEQIPENLRQVGLAPVGRLDRDATGLIILTNDGTLNHRLASPRFGIWKTYRLTYRGEPLTEEICRLFAEGLPLPDGLVCRPAILSLRGDNEADLMIQEGKYHQVKRMIKAVNREVQSLQRIAFGPLELDKNLLPGQCRELTQEEIDALYEAVQLSENRTES